MTRRVLVVAAAFVGWVHAAAPAAAHDAGGLFLPLVSDLVIEGSALGTGRSVWLRVVDADSAQPAEGMRVALITGRATSALNEVASGFYAGDVAVGPGENVMSVLVQAGPAGPLSRELRKSWTVAVPPLGTRVVVTGGGDPVGLKAAERSPTHAARLAAAEKGRKLAVRIEVVEDPGLASPLYVRAHAHVQSGVSGQLDPTVYEVHGWAVDRSGTETEFVRFNPLDAVDPAYAAGTYGGVVILASGGEWTMKVGIFEVRRHAADPPIAVAQGELPLVRTGSALQRARTAVDRLAQPRANIFNTLVLALHSLSAALWGVVLAALLALTYDRAKVLSSWARNALEQNLDRLIRAGWVATALVVFTGVYNLYEESPYRTVPKSWNSLHDVLHLPFARPYYSALGIKLGAYSVLVCCALQLIRNARASRGATSSRHRTNFERSPWTPSVDPYPAGRAATAVAGRQRPLPSAIAPLMALCAVTIVVCVTILKAAHLLVEVTRTGS